MAQYYGIERTDEYLEHYGVKGMKWGVRKAIETGNARRLDRTWRRANRKLRRLNKKANYSIQERKTAFRSEMAGAGAFGGGMAGFTAINKPIMQKLGKWGVPASAGATVAGTALGAIPFAIASEKSRKRLTSAGHKKALKETHQWTDEMNSAFKGTKYEGKAEKFPDLYASIRRKYGPKEAKAGNAMPYTTVVKFHSGTELARNYDRRHNKKTKKKSRS